MNSNQKQMVTDQLIKVLANNNVTFSEVPEVIKKLEVELDLLCKQQVIQNP
ncbi:hypothetical protein [Siminovitchia fordii]|uniref:hypothetical protein n=1 Tax=Siminovitchia fordii TaxID=254759 RepID=UPI00036F28BC|nr:hypothetical protein [Siminovitchia fordii]